MNRLRKMIEQIHKRLPHSQVGLDKHTRLVEKHDGEIHAEDVHEASWDILIAPMGLMALLIRQHLQPILKTKWADRPVHASIVNSSEVNAVAIPGKQAYHILIFRGLMEQILGYTWALFGTREFLPNIGESAKERSVEHTVEHFGQRANLVTGAASVAPRCLHRELVASLTAQTALDIALLHEYGHIIGGHFNFFRTGADCTALDEMMVQKQQVELNVPLSVIEWDADCFAANYSFHVHKPNEITRFCAPATCEYGSRSINYNMVLWTLAGHILFRSIATSPTYTYVPSPAQYPPPPLRGANFVYDLVRRRGDMRGKYKNATIEVFTLAVMIETVCARRFGIHQGNEWMEQGLAKHDDMMKLYQPHRERLEEVRRTTQTWRPIHSE